MAIEINNNTVIRLIVRRGAHSDLTYATLVQGELGFTTDTNRLVIGANNQKGLAGITVAGNKFLGEVQKESISSPFYGDYVYDEGKMYIYTTTGWKDASFSPTADTGLTVTNGQAIAFDPQYTSWSSFTSLTGSNKQLFVGTASATPGYTAAGGDSRLISQGPISVFGSPTSTNRVLLSAGPNKGLVSLEGTSSIINAGTSGIMVGTDALYLVGTNALYLSTFNNKTFTVKNGLTSGTLQNLSASPSFVFDGGAVRINSSLYCSGSARFEGGILENITTTVSATSSFIIDITSVTAPSVTGLSVKDDNATDGQWLTVMESNGKVLFAAKADNGGFVGINDSTSYSNSNFTVSGNQYYHGGPFTVKSHNITLSGNNITVNGDLSATGDIIGFSTSDERLKNNINRIDNALQKLLALKGVEFDWRPEAPTIHTGHDIGVIAQDVIKQIPEAVSVRHDGYYGVYYEKLIPFLIEAIRELNNKIK